MSELQREKHQAERQQQVNLDGVYLHALERLHAYTRWIETSGREGKKLSPTELSDLLLMVRELGRSKGQAPRAPAGRQPRPVPMQAKPLKQLLDEALETYPELAEALEGVG